MALVQIYLWLHFWPCSDMKRGGRYVFYRHFLLGLLISIPCKLFWRFL